MHNKVKVANVKITDENGIKQYNVSLEVWGIIIYKIRLLTLTLTSCSHLDADFYILFQIWYDINYQLVRYDLVNPNPMPPLYDPNPMTFIHDFNTGEQYYTYERYLLVNPNHMPPLYDPNPMTFIHDFNTGEQYYTHERYLNTGEQYYTYERYPLVNPNQVGSIRSGEP